MAYSDTQIVEYNAYLEFLKTSEGTGFPVPADMADYYAHREEWTKEWGGVPVSPNGQAIQEAWQKHLQLIQDYFDGKATKEEVEASGKWYHQLASIPSAEPSIPQKSAYDRYQMYATLYGDPDDWYPKDMQSFFDNYDIGREQLDEWVTEASRDYQEYRDLASHRKPGDWYTTNLDDFVANYEQAQKQQDIWLGLYGEAEAEQTELDEYYARQRERSEAAAQEAYRPEVQYGPAFYQKQEALQGESVYYADWMRQMYPELQRRFEATQPRPVGYPTREEARAAAGQKEQAWGQYLTGEAPELRQEFYGQRPYERGERPSIYQPRIRQVSY